MLIRPRPQARLPLIALLAPIAGVLCAAPARADSHADINYPGTTFRSHNGAHRIVIGRDGATFTSDGRADRPLGLPSRLTEDGVFLISDDGRVVMWVLKRRFVGHGGTREAVVVWIDGQRTYQRRFDLLAVPRRLLQRSVSHTTWRHPIQADPQLRRVAFTTFDLVEYVFAPREGHGPVIGLYRPLRTAPLCVHGRLRLALPPGAGEPMRGELFVDRYLVGEGPQRLAVQVGPTRSLALAGRLLDAVLRETRGRYTLAPIEGSRSYRLTDALGTEGRMLSASDREGGRVTARISLVPTRVSFTGGQLRSAEAAPDHALLVIRVRDIALGSPRPYEARYYVNLDANDRPLSAYLTVGKRVAAVALEHLRLTVERPLRSVPAGLFNVDTRGSLAFDAPLPVRTYFGGGRVRVRGLAFDWLFPDRLDLPRDD